LNIEQGMFNFEVFPHFKILNSILDIRHSISLSYMQADFAIVALATTAECTLRYAPFDKLTALSNI